MLTNEAYVGNIVFNRKSFKLKGSYVENPTDMWIRHDGAVAPIVPISLFDKAQVLRSQRIETMTDREALDRLTVLWCRTGRLSTKIIEKAAGIPSPTTYMVRFGSLARAYALIGYRLPPRHRFADSKQRVKNVMAAVVRALVVNAAMQFDEKTRILTTPNGLIVSLRVAWHYRHGVRGEQRWHLKGSPYARPALDVQSALTLVIRMKVKNEGIDDYNLIPTARLELSKDRKLRFIRKVFAEQFRYLKLEQLYPIMAAA